MKNITRYGGMIFALLALLSLGLPVFSTYISDVESGMVVVCGYNMVEFSPWGSIVVILPLLTIGLALSKMNVRIKTAGLLGLLPVAGVAMHYAVESAHDWINTIATGFVQSHMGHLIYALCWLISAICFWLSSNLPQRKNDPKTTMLPPSITVKPVDYREEKFILCNKRYDMVEYTEKGQIALGEYTLLLATREGFFAGLGNPQASEGHHLELTENGESVAFVMATMPTRLFGSFYEGQECFDDPFAAVTIRPFCEIEKGKATIKFPGETVDDFWDDIYIDPRDINDIRLSGIEESESSRAIGAAIFQGPDLIAFVTEYDASNREYKCISAEMIAIDFCRKIYEQRIREVIHENAFHAS